VARFYNDNRQIVSCSDDQTIKCWDVLSAKSVYQLDGHEDYVRCIDFREDLSDVIVSGSYDHNVILWDTRSGKVTSTLEHSYPLEEVKLLDSQQLVSLSGNDLNIWDIRTKQVINTVNNHHKTITCLSLIPRESITDQVILTGSLDQRVSLYSIDSDISYSAQYNAPVLSLTTSDKYIIMGLSDGTVIFRGQGLRGERDEEEKKIITQSNTKSRNIQNLLLKFRYGDALDNALLNNNTVLIISLIDEFITRNVLKLALHWRNEQQLIPLLDFIQDNITNDQFTGLLVIVLNKLLDLYGGFVGHSLLFDTKLKQIQETLKQEINTERELMHVVGIMNLINQNNTNKKNNN